MSETESEKVVSVSSRGQATIPKEFREELGIDTPGRVKLIRTEEGDIVVRPIRSVTDLRGVLEGKPMSRGAQQRSASKRNVQRTKPVKKSCDSATPVTTRLTNDGLR
nr:AbrB/MazE/SpoVT family DNA-binding domain-containing protein [Halorubrum sp. SD690R]